MKPSIRWSRTSTVAGSRSAPLACRRSRISRAIATPRSSWPQNLTPPSGSHRARVRLRDVVEERAPSAGRRARPSSPSSGAASGASMAAATAGRGRSGSTFAATSAGRVDDVQRVVEDVEVVEADWSTPCRRVHLGQHGGSTPSSSQSDSASTGSRTARMRLQLGELPLAGGCGRERGVARARARPSPAPTANSSSAASRGRRSSRSGSSRNTPSPTARSAARGDVGEAAVRVGHGAVGERHGDGVGGEVAPARGPRPARRARAVKSTLRRAVHDAPGAVALATAGTARRRAPRVRPGGRAGIARHDACPSPRTGRPSRWSRTAPPTSQPSSPSQRAGASAGELVAAEPSRRHLAVAAIGPVAQAARDLVADRARPRGPAPRSARRGRPASTSSPRADAHVVGQDHRELVHRHGADRAAAGRATTTWPAPAAGRG